MVKVSNFNITAAWDYQAEKTAKMKYFFKSTFGGRVPYRKSRQ